MDEIREDIAAARAIGVTGTPIFLVNGKRVADYRNRALDADRVSHPVAVEYE